MGAYTNIKGWIQIPEENSEFANEVLDKSSKKYLNYSLTPEQYDLYHEGWVFQQRSINGYIYLFYGAEIRTCFIEYIWSIASEIATIKHIFDEGIIYPDGFFHLSEDGTHSIGSKKWLLNEGALTEYICDEI